MRVLFRVGDTLANMQEIYGDREVVLVRELTKIYEEYRRGKISEVLESLTDQPIKGECLIIVSGADEVAQEVQEPELTALEAVKVLVEQSVKPNVAIKQIAKERGLNRQELYAEFHDL